MANVTFLRTSTLSDTEALAMYADTALPTLCGESDLGSGSDSSPPTRSPPPENTWDGLHEAKGEILYDFEQNVNFWEVDQSAYTYPYLSLLCFDREDEVTHWETEFEVKSTAGAEFWDIVDLDWHYARYLELSLRSNLAT